jgi:hypothetical protein
MMTTRHPSHTGETMRPPTRSDERGIALAVAVFALVIIGVLVAGTFFVGRLEQRTASNAVYSSQAAEAAEAGLVRELELWNPIEYKKLQLMAATTPPVPYDTVLGTVSLGGRLEYTSTLRKLNSDLFLLRAEGRRLDAGGNVLAARTLGRVVRVKEPTVNVNAGITVTQPIQLNGNAFYVDGTNSNPQWDNPATPSAEWCAPPSAGTADDKVAIRSATGTGVSGADLDNIAGWPQKYVQNDPSITPATFQNFLDYTFETLGSQPGVKMLPLSTTYSNIRPVASAGACDKNNATYQNLGEPLRDYITYSPAASPPPVPECYTYFPTVHGTANRTKFAAGSRGQGILLIDGDLEINGGFEWTGLILVKGSFKIGGTGNKITGAVLAQGVTGDNSISGDVEINYSQCALEYALAGSAHAVPIQHRGWMQLFGL